MNALRLMLLLLLCCLATGCAAWKPISHDQIVTTIEQHPSGRIRVQADGETLELRKPVLQGDTLAGQRIDQDRPRPVSVPLSSIRSMELIRGGPRTAAMAIGVMFGMFLLITIAATRPTVIY